MHIRMSVLWFISSHPAPRPPPSEVVAINPDHTSLGRDSISSEESKYLHCQFPRGICSPTGSKDWDLQTAVKRNLHFSYGICQFCSGSKDLVEPRMLLWGEVGQLLLVPWKQVAKKESLVRGKRIPLGLGSSHTLFYGIFLLLFWNIREIWSLLCCDNKKRPVPPTRPHTSHSRRWQCPVHNYVPGGNSKTQVNPPPHFSKSRKTLVILFLRAILGHKECHPKPHTPLLPNEMTSVWG